MQFIQQTTTMMIARIILTSLVLFSLPGAVLLDVIVLPLLSWTVALFAPEEDCTRYRHAGSCGVDDDDVLCPELDGEGCYSTHEGCLARGYVPGGPWLLLQSCQRYRRPGRCELDDDDGYRCPPILYMGDLLMVWETPASEDVLHRECLDRNYVTPYWAPKRCLRKLLNFWRPPKKLCALSPWSSEEQEDL